MKFLAVLTVLSCLSSAHALEEFGGINFQSSVPADQVTSLKNDLRYLFTTPVTESDAEFLATTGLSAGTGDHLHNWIYNRVRYIVGESYDLQRNFRARPKLFFKYPKSPLPDGMSGNSINVVQIVMSNLGGAVYLTGKKADVLLGLDMDGDLVSVKSARTGILQVGSGLFYDGFWINKTDVNAPSNSVSRLGTLFHEARHSDGNGKSTGFLHDICPAGHQYEGHAACEVSGNGSYTVGALSERHMVKNCSSCTTEEKTILVARIADSFNRVFDRTKAQARASLLAELASAKQLLEMYQTGTWPRSMRAQVDAEIRTLRAKVTALEAQLANLTITPDVRPASLDPRAEGSFKEESVEKSARLMRKSL